MAKSLVLVFNFVFPTKIFCLTAESGSSAREENMNKTLKTNSGRCPLITQKRSSLDWLIPDLLYASQIESIRGSCYIRLYKNGIKKAKIITIETTRGWTGSSRLVSIDRNYIRSPEDNCSTNHKASEIWESRRFKLWIWLRVWVWIWFWYWFWRSHQIPGKVKNCLMNRLNCINNKVNFSWLNKSLDSFKIHCKLTFLA